jgi:hypothetical protein
MLVVDITRAEAGDGLLCPGQEASHSCAIAVPPRQDMFGQEAHAQPREALAQRAICGGTGDFLADVGLGCDDGDGSGPVRPAPMRCQGPANGPLRHKE